MKSPPQTCSSDISKEPSLISDNLFRPESVAAARSPLGAPVALTGVSSWLMCSFFFSLFMTTLVIICTCKYARKETVPGTVTPIDGAPRIIAIRSGVAEHVLVTEGQQVKTGQELISIVFSPKLELGKPLASGLQQNHQEQVTAHSHQVIAKQEQLKHQREEILVHLHGIEADISKLNTGRTLQEERIRIQEETVIAMHKLGEQGLVASLNVRAKDEALIATRQSLAGIDREITQQKNLILQLKATLERMHAEEALLNSDSSVIDAQLGEKKLNAEANYSDHLTSPIDGIVTALQTKSGAAVNSNQTLAIIVPNQHGINNSNLEVELWAPSRSVGFVKPGAIVRLMYDSFPYQSFGVGHGIVRDVSLAPMTPNEQTMGVSTKEQMYRIRVSLTEATLSAYGRKWPLLPGMSLSADLVLEERSLLDWLLEPLLASKRRAE